MARPIARAAKRRAVPAWRWRRIVPSRRFDILIAGAGPAGIAAACAASEGGGSIGVVDASPAAGGQIWRGETSRCVTRFYAARGELLPPTLVLAARPAGTLAARQAGRQLQP